MTNKHTGTSGLVEVTQADRDAAADYLTAKGDPPLRAINIRNGRGDDGPTVQAFAKHRLASLSPVPVDEVERGVNCHDCGGRISTACPHCGAHLMSDKDLAALTASRPSDDGEVERATLTAGLLARAIDPPLWSDDEETAYMAASPLQVSYVRERALRNAEQILNELAALSSRVGEKGE